MVQQIVLVYPSELRHRSNYRGGISGFPSGFQYLICLLLKRSLSSEEAGLPRVDKPILGNICPWFHVGGRCEGEGGLLQGPQGGATPRHQGPENSSRMGARAGREGVFSTVRIWGLPEDL